MALEIKKVEYFNFPLDSNSEEAYNLLSTFADAGISLLAFKAIPTDDKRTLFSLFPNDSSKMKDAIVKAGLNYDGPHTALIIKSDSDNPGECGDIFKKLSQTGISTPISIGIADIKDSYGMVLCLEPEYCDKALEALKD